MKFDDVGIILERRFLQMHIGNITVEQVRGLQTEIRYLNEVLGKKVNVVNEMLTVIRELRTVSLLCPLCGGTVQIISFVTETPSVRRILEHIGEPMEPPRISPAREPPIWSEEINQDSYGDPLAQPVSDDDFEQTINW